MYMYCSASSNAQANRVQALAAAEQAISALKTFAGVHPVAKPFLLLWSAVLETQVSGKLSEKVNQKFIDAKQLANQFKMPHCEALIEYWHAQCLPSKLMAAKQTKNANAKFVALGCLPRPTTTSTDITK